MTWRILPETSITTTMSRQQVLQGGSVLLELIELLLRLELVLLELMLELLELKLVELLKLELVELLLELVLLELTLLELMLLEELLSQHTMPLAYMLGASPAQPSTKCPQVMSPQVT
jgi:hypothetical protein